jgi:tRNA pseudouridine38-40 synthase
MIRSSTPASLVSKTFGPETLNIPKAPALGLLLERPIFNVYNARVTSMDEPRPPVSFDQFEVTKRPPYIGMVDRVEFVNAG